MMPEARVMTDGSGLQPRDSASGRPDMSVEVSKSSQPGSYLTRTAELIAQDPSHGRCMRTDGKRWRCARPIVSVNDKYCERHVHRGLRYRAEVATKKELQASQPRMRAGVLRICDLVNDDCSGPVASVSVTTGSKSYGSMTHAAASQPSDTGGVSASTTGPLRSVSTDLQLFPPAVDCYGPGTQTKLHMPMAMGSSAGVSPWLYRLQLAHARQQQVAAVQQAQAQGPFLPPGGPGLRHPGLSIPALSIPTFCAPESALSPGVSSNLGHMVNSPSEVTTGRTGQWEASRTSGQSNPAGSGGGGSVRAPMGGPNSSANGPIMADGAPPGPWGDGRPSGAHPAPSTERDYFRGPPGGIAAGASSSGVTTSSSRALLDGAPPGAPPGSGVVQVLPSPHQFLMLEHPSRRRSSNGDTDDVCAVPAMRPWSKYSSMVAGKRTASVNELGAGEGPGSGGGGGASSPPDAHAGMGSGQGLSRFAASPVNEGVLEGTYLPPPHALPPNKRMRQSGFSQWK